MHLPYPYLFYCRNARTMESLYLPPLNLEDLINRGQSLNNLFILPTDIPSIFKPYHIRGLGATAIKPYEHQIGLGWIGLFSHSQPLLNPGFSCSRGFFYYLVQTTHPLEIQSLEHMRSSQFTVSS